MIATQIFNFKREGLNAAKYRLRLRNLNKDSAKEEVESLYFLKRFKEKNLNFSSLNRRKVIDGILIEQNYKNFAFFLNLENRKLNVVLDKEESFEKKTKNYFKSLNKELIKIKENVKEEKLKSFSKYNKIKVINFFKEKEFIEEYDLVDFKTNHTFKKSDQCFYKQGAIQTKTINESSLDIINIEIIKEESFLSDELEVLDIDSETSYIKRKDKVWNCLIGKKQYLANGQLLPEKTVKLNLVINLDGFEEFNNFILESGSSLPYEINTNKFFIYTEDRVWNQVEIVKVIDRFNYKEFIFNSVFGSKIKLELIQSKYHDTSNLSETENSDRLNKVLNRSFLQYENKIKAKEVKRIHDFSILSIQVKRKYNYRYGYYREADPVYINKPYSCNFEINKIYESENCFIEKYLHVVLYGDANIKGYKEKLLQSTQRLNKVIPIPNNNIEETERLLLDGNKIAVLNFFPRLKKDLTDLNEVIEVYENNTKLNMFQDYVISFNGGNSYIETEDNSVNMAFAFKEDMVKSFWIKFTKPINNINTYSCKYRLAESIYCDENKLLKLENSEIVFSETMQESVGFIRPVIIFRNRSILSSQVDELKVSVEEKEQDLFVEVDYETFFESKAKGNNNVI